MRQTSWSARDAVQSSLAASYRKAGRVPEIDEREERIFAVLRDEMRERMDLIERMAAAFSEPDCENCEGSGMDYEGDEWTLCACATLVLQKEERVRAEWSACR